MEKGYYKVIIDIEQKYTSNSTILAASPQEPSFKPNGTGLAGSCTSGCKQRSGSAAEEKVTNDWLLIGYCSTLNESNVRLPVYVSP